MVNSQQNNASVELNSETQQKVDQVYLLKQQLDLVYKQLNHYKGAFKSVDRLNRMLTKLVKMERNYRVWRRRLRKMDRELANVDLYAKVYDLYESLVIGGQCDNLNETNEIVSNDDDQDNTEQTIIEYSPAHEMEVYDDTEQIYSITTEVITEDQFAADDLERLNHPTSNNDNNICVSESLNTVSNENSSPKIQKQSANKNIKNSNRNRSKSTTKTSNPNVLSKSKSVVNSQDSQRIEKDNRPFKCSKCEASFITYAELKDHRSTHAGKRSFCPYEGCNVSYAKQSEVNRHIRIVHLKVAKLLQCPECDYTNYRLDYLKSHMLIHSGERPYKCNICHQNFRLSSSLINHRNTHGEKQFHCNYEGCNYSGRFMANLRKHQAAMHLAKQTEFKRRRRNIKEEELEED